MPTKEHLEKEERINKEERRLRGSYRKIPKEKMKVADGLIRRAAYMRITLEDYETDLDTNGYIEMFSQSERLDPYERERPVARLYNTMNKNYQSIIRQLADLLPKALKDEDEDDGFNDFVNNR